MLNHKGHKGDKERKDRRQKNGESEKCLELDCWPYCTPWLGCDARRHFSVPHIFLSSFFISSFFVSFVNFVVKLSVE